MLLPSEIQLRIAMLTNHYAGNATIKLWITTYPIELHPHLQIHPQNNPLELRQQAPPAPEVAQNRLAPSGAGQQRGNFRLNRFAGLASSGGGWPGWGPSGEVPSDDVRRHAAGAALFCTPFTTIFRRRARRVAGMAIQRGDALLVTSWHVNGLWLMSFRGENGKGRLPSKLS